MAWQVPRREFGAPGDSTDKVARTDAAGIESRLRMVAAAVVGLGLALVVATAIDRVGRTMETAAVLTAEPPTSRDRSVEPVIRSERVEGAEVPRPDDRLGAVDGSDPGDSSGSTPPGSILPGSASADSDLSDLAEEAPSDPITAPSESSPPSVGAGRGSQPSSTGPSLSPESTEGSESLLPTPVGPEATTESEATSGLGAEAESAERLQAFVGSAGVDSVEYITPRLAYGRVDGDGTRVSVLILHQDGEARIRVSPGARRAARVGSWAAEIGASAAVNANWFTGDGGFDGPAVSDGAAYGGDDHHYTALFGFTADGSLVADHHSTVNPTVDPRINQAISGHPTLIEHGRITTDFGGDPTFTRRHPRTAIGSAYGGEIVIFVVVDGRSIRSRGMTGAETAALMAGLGAENALMLDGGGSSAMWIDGRGVVNSQSDPGRPVGNQIAILG